MISNWRPLIVGIVFEVLGCSGGYLLHAYVSEPLATAVQGHPVFLKAHMLFGWFSGDRPTAMSPSIPCFELLLSIAFHLLFELLLLAFVQSDLYQVKKLLVAVSLRSISLIAMSAMTESSTASRNCFVHHLIMMAILFRWDTLQRMESLGLRLHHHIDFVRSQRCWLCAQVSAWLLLEQCLILKWIWVIVNVIERIIRLKVRMRGLIVLHWLGVFTSTTTVLIGLVAAVSRSLKWSHHGVILWNDLNVWQVSKWLLVVSYIGQRLVLSVEMTDRRLPLRSVRANVLRL